MCPTCNIIKTPRVFHCKTCDACISVHDHHCPWLGTCVGQRNHKMFIYYGWATKVHSAYSLALCVRLIMSNENVAMSPSDPNFAKLYIAQVGMAVYTFFVTLLLFFLTGYHTYLVCTNSTSSEDLKDKHKLWGGNPYDQGLSYNLKYFFKT